jgi:tubulin-specific chaperone D
MLRFRTVPIQLNGHKIDNSHNDEPMIEEEMIDIPTIVQSILDLLMAGLSDKELYVRWSSAKGLGRITNRLQKSYAAQLVSHLCDRIAGVALLACDHFALQGGCLALAELARRGLLLPDRLDSVMPIVHKSLNYDEKLGHQTYGHIVRDAACYVSCTGCASVRRCRAILCIFLGLLVICSSF